MPMGLAVGFHLSKRWVLYELNLGFVSTISSEFNFLQVHTWNFIQIQNSRKSANWKDIIAVPRRTRYAQSYCDVRS